MDSQSIVEILDIKKRKQKLIVLTVLIDKADKNNIILF